MKTSYLYKAMFLTSAIGLSACGGEETTKEVLLNQAPTAVITTEQSINNVEVNKEVIFYASKSIDVDGSIAKYIWNAEGTTEETTEAKYTKSFDSAGTKVVTLVVVDDDGKESQPYSVSVNVVAGTVVVQPDPTVPEVTKVDITSTETQVTLAEKITLAVEVSLDDGSTESTATWSVNPSSMAEVSSAGVLTPLSAGTVTVTATSGEHSDSIEIELIEPQKTAKEIVLSSTELALDVMQTKAVTYEAYYSDDSTAEEPVVEWSCDDESVVEVTENGLLAKGAGTTICSVSWLGKTASLAVTVSEPKITVTGVSVSPAAVTLDKGKSQQASALVSYSEGEDESNPEGIAWQCDDTDVATISNSGLIAEVAEGSTTCSASIGEKSGAVAVTVKYEPVVNGPDDVESIVVESASITLEKDTTKQLSATVTYADGETETDPDFVEWTCEGEEVEITKGGLLTAKAKSEGNDCSATVTGRSTEDLVAATLKVIVTDNSTGNITPVSVERLGAVYTEASTHFAIWAPDSSSVQVKILNPDGSDFGDGTYELSKGNYAEYEEQVFKAEVAGVPLYAQYQFLLDGQPVRDPYGMMVTPDQVEPANEYNIVMARTQKGPEGKEWSPVADNGYYKEREDAVIYEIHIRDLTMDANSGVDESLKGTFSGFVQRGTTHPEDNSIKTGIDHLVELGVTHVQILPMYDFATCSMKAGPENRTQIYPWNNLDWEADCFNWGYDPENFNIPEEYYASVAKDDYQGRIDEVKYFIDELHKAGIRVIMDVVYNHTYLWIDGVTSDMDGGNWSTTSPRTNCGTDDCPIEDPYVHETMLTPITTRYFTEKGLSGTGNSLSVEPGNPMVNRFIQDSMEFWINEYNIDGFRFDLVGIFDHSVYGDWGRYLNAKFPEKNLLIYGEPWNGYKYDPREDMRVRYWTIDQQADAHVGIFNGIFREAIKGNNDANPDQPNTLHGYISDGRSADTVKGGMLGSIGSSDGGNLDERWKDVTFTADPEQTINYVSAHDNLSIADKIHKMVGSDENYQKKLSMFANGIVFTSQGIPFIHAGSEIFRKKDDRFHSAHNSYRSPSVVNDIQWDWKANNSEVFDYYKDMIKIRKENSGFRLTSASEISNNASSKTHDNGVLEVYLKATKGGWSDTLVLLNSTGGDKTLNIGTGWKYAAKGTNAAMAGEAVSGDVEIKDRSITIVYKD